MTQALFILAAFIVFAGLFASLRMGTVVGLLIAGVAIGPSGAGIVDDVHAIAPLAEFGVVFLLFNVGLEIKLERLRLLGARVYALAITQVVLTAGAFGAAAYGLGTSVEAAVVVGSALALSSTAIVIQILGELGRTLTHLGRLAIATLIVQDIAVGPLLVMVTTMGGGDTDIGALVLGGTVALAMVVLGARLVLPYLLNHVAALRTPELFVALTLLVVLSASWATEHAGLSAALGAFLAGLMVADTPYRHQIAADIAPFRGLFLGLFFMTVGMKVDLQLTMAEPFAVAALVCGIVLVKAVLLFVIALSLGFGRRLGVQLSGLMAQGSEFSFVLLGIAATAGLLVSTTANLLIVAVAVSMLVTPLLAAAFRNRLDRFEGEASSRLARLDADSGELHGHVLIIGFGQVGMALSRHLLGLGTPLLVLDADSQRVRAARGRNLPVYFGNATRTEVLRAAHVEQAAVVVIAVPEPRVASRIAMLAQRLAPAACIIARAPEQSDADALREAGARAVVLDGLTTAVELAERVVIQLETDGTVAV